MDGGVLELEFHHHVTLPSTPMNLKICGNQTFLKLKISSRIFPKTNQKTHQKTPCRISRTQATRVGCWSLPPVTCPSAITRTAVLPAPRWSFPRLWPYHLKVSKIQGQIVCGGEGGPKTKGSIPLEVEESKVTKYVSDLFLLIFSYISTVILEFFCLPLLGFLR